MKTQAQFQTAEEQRVLADIATQEAAGKDPFGDDEFENAPAAQAEGEQTEAAEGAEAAAEGEQAAAEGAEGEEAKPEAASEGEEAVAEGEEAPSPEALAAIAAEDEDDEPDPAPYTPKLDAEAAKTKREELLAKKAEAFKKVVDGEMEPAEYAKIDAEVSDGLEQLTVDRALIAQSAQDAHARQVAVINGIKALAKSADKLDYDADAKAVSQFNRALQLVAADPDNAGLSFKAMAKEAHRTVLAMRGLKAAPAPAPTAAAPAAPAAARKAPAAPVTLRNVPAAATHNSGGDIGAQLSRLSGVDFEDAFRRLSPAQQAQMLDD